MEDDEEDEVLRVVLEVLFFFLLWLAVLSSSSESCPSWRLESDKVALERLSVLPFLFVSPDLCERNPADDWDWRGGDEGDMSVCPPEDKAPAGIAREPEKRIW